MGTGDNGANVQLRSAGFGAPETGQDPAHLLNLVDTSAPPKKMGVASGTGRSTDARASALKIRATKRRAIATTTLNVPEIWFAERTTALQVSQPSLARTSPTVVRSQRS